MFSYHYHHHDHNGQFRYPSYFYRLPNISMENDEMIIMEGPAKFRIPQKDSVGLLFPGEISYNDAQGVLALTNKRLIYCFLPFTRNAIESDFMFVSQINAIKSVSNKGWGYSILIVETDVIKTTGLSKNEFWVFNSGKWVEEIQKLLNETTRKITQEQQPAISDKRFEKVCLSCMGIVPEDVDVCPKCGNAF